MKNEIFNMITAILAKDKPKAVELSKTIFNAKSKKIMEGEVEEVEPEVETTETASTEEKV
jgi:hypothetical protein